MVVVLGLLLGGAGYLALRVATIPGPRDAPGWDLRAEMPDARGETATAVAGDRVFVLGGLEGLTAAASSRVSIYDPTSDRWSAGPDLPAARHHAAAIGLDGAVYLSGGAPSATDWTPSDSFWVLQPGATSWRELPPLPEGRLGHRMVAIEGRIYVVGGVAPRPKTGTDPGRAVLVFDPESRTWVERAAMPIARDHLAAVVVDGEIWTIGGRAGGRNFDLVDVYDPTADAWREGPRLPAATSGAAEGIVDGVILVSGGEDPGAGLIVDRQRQLDTRSGTGAGWQPLSPPPFTVHGVAGAVLDGRFVIVGGSLRPGAESSTAWTGATQYLRERP